jgi:hypothetical protein
MIRAQQKEAMETLEKKKKKKHKSIKTNLLEAFIAKRDEYPELRSNAIALLNKYNERKQPPTAASEGTAFAQKGKKKTTDTKSKKGQ